VERGAEDVDPVLVPGVDPDLAEVHRRGFTGLVFDPGGAGVVAPVDAALLLVLDPGVEDVGVAAEDVDADPAEGPTGMPLVSWVQVRPASVLFQRPLWGRRR